MSFSVTPKDAPAKVEGALNGSVDRPKTARERAIEALTGANPPASQTAPTTPNIDPAALAASNTPSAPGQISTSDFAAIQAKAHEAANNQTPTNETAKATPPKTDSEATKTEEGTEQTLSPRYAQLARQEKVIRARTAQLKADQAALEQAKTALTAREAELQTKYVPKERLSQETLTVLQEMGIDYDALTQQALGEAPDPRDTKIKALEAKIEALSGQFEQSAKTSQEEKTKAYSDAVSAIKNNVTKLVNSDPQFETIKATESVQDVVELIESTFHEGLDEDHPKGTVLTVEEAAQIVEDYLADEAEKLARLAKIQKRLAPKEQTPPKQDSSVQPQRQPTLTNGMTGAPKREYTQRQRALFAAQHGVNWREKVGEKAS